IEIPANCIVLVIGGGPGGSYTAAALAREGIDVVVLLEADGYPRGHASIIPTLSALYRPSLGVYRLRFRHKDTEFISAGGPNNFTWNVTRSEADDLMFRHAKASGANVFDGVEVNDINFDNISGHSYAASYSQKATGAKGTINFRYLVDASGRAGLVNTKYVKNRTYNTALKNVAHWDYWRETKPRILSPTLMQLISDGELTGSVKSASDYSYGASTYSSPYIRVVGDAGCFIDPFFSSGVHIALTGALSAAVTICAALKHECEKAIAADWHTMKIKGVFQRFLMVSLSAYHQMRRQNVVVWSHHGRDNFDEALEHIKIIIQGTTDVGGSVISYPR
ncbi:Flavine halogenase aclH, partial [Penicillium fimorum]